ncbi:MAG: chromate transporter, partial [Pseudanabaena sp. ELA748]
MSEYTKNDFESESDVVKKDQDLPQSKTKLLDLAIVFTKLGAIAFGGPAAHIAQIELEVVQRRQWLSREKLLDLLSISNLIPGPNSTELVIHVGLEQAGILGAIVAGVCFIVPAMLLVWGLAIAYVEYQTLPVVGWLLYGVKPVIIAIISQSLSKLGRSGLKNATTWVAGVLVLILYFFNINEVALMLGAGLIVTLVHNFNILKKTNSLSIILFPFSLLPLTSP